MTTTEIYKKFCNETKRGGGVLIGSSIHEAINYVVKEVLTDIKEQGLKNSLQYVANEYNLKTKTTLMLIQDKLNGNNK